MKATRKLTVAFQALPIGHAVRYLAKRAGYSKATIYAMSRRYEENGIGDSAGYLCPVDVTWLLAETDCICELHGDGFNPVRELLEKPFEKYYAMKG